MTKRRKSDSIVTADGHVRIQRTVLRRVVCERLQALLRGDFYVRNHLGPEDYDTLVKEVEAIDMMSPPPPPRDDGGNNGNAAATDADGNAANGSNGGNIAATAAVEFTPDLETFVQLIAASIMIDASMRGENAGESDIRFIKKKKKLLMTALRGPRLYDFRREFLRFDRIKNGGGTIMDDEEILSEESDGLESNDTDSVEEVVERRGKKIEKVPMKKKTKTDDALPPLVPMGRTSSSPLTTTTHRQSFGGESSSADDYEGGSLGGEGRRLQSPGGKDDSSDSGGGTSSANSQSSAEEESLTLDGFSTSATSSKHHHKKSKEKKREKKTKKREKERKRLMKKEDKRRKKEKRKKKKEKKRRAAEEKELLRDHGRGNKKRFKEYSRNEELSDDDERADNAVASDASIVTGEGGDEEGSNNCDSGEDGGYRSSAEQHHRPRNHRKRKRYEHATKEEFDKYKSEWLGLIPKDVKSRFREGGFSKWGKDWLPVLELGPFDVEPGPVRDMWFDMYRNTQEKERDMTRLVFWYGVKFEDRGQAYSFVPRIKIVNFEEGERLGHCKMPKKIQQKVEKDSKLTKTEEQIRSGLIEILSDMKKDKSDRIEWMMHWKEDYEYAEEEAEIKPKLARLVIEEDAPKKRGPGRPKKEGTTTSDVHVPIKRKPGRPKKSVDTAPPLDDEYFEVVKKKGPGRPKKLDKEKAECADEKKAKKKTSTVKKYEMMVMDKESEIETDDDDGTDGDSGSDDEANADTDDNNFDVGSGVKSVGEKRKSVSSKKEPTTKNKMTVEEKVIEKRFKAAEYREKIRREELEAQGLEYTKGKVGSKSKAALLEMEQMKFTKCEGVFKPIIEQLTQARDDNDYKVAMECIHAITEQVAMLTPPFFRDYQLGMLVKSVRKKFEGVHPEAKDCCHRLTTEMKRVYFEKNDKVPDGFEPVKNYYDTPNVKHVTSEEKEESSVKTEREVEVKSKKVVIKKEKIGRDQSLPSQRSSEISLAESATRRMASAAPSEYLPNVVTSDPPEPRPKKAFSIKDMFDKPKPAPKPIVSAPSSSSLVVSSRHSSSKLKFLPSWITGPAMKREDFHDQHMKERSFGLEFLADAASSVATATDKFDPTSVSQSFELAIFAETKLRGRDWHEYWEKIHDVAAMLSPGKDKRNALLQGIFNGDYREPSELVKLSRREIHSLNQLKS